MKILFLGNGFNRINDHHTYSWGSLMEQLRIAAALEPNAAYGKPFPFFYEEIYLETYRRHATSEETLLNSVLKTIANLSLNNLYHQLPDLPMDAFITTNYDYLIEQSLSDQKLQREVTYKDGPERKYRIRTYNQVDHYKVWHIHGEQAVPSTLVLGQKMYADVVSQIVKYIEQQDPTQRNSWIDYLFYEEVHILGYGMQYEEISVWAVLNERARKIAKQQLPLNKIVYYDYQGDDQQWNQSFHSLLESHHIHVEVNHIGEDYEAFYQRILNELKNEHNN